MMGTFMNVMSPLVTWPSVGAGMHLDLGTTTVPCLLVICGRLHGSVPESGCSFLWGSKPPDRHRALPTKEDLLKYLQTRSPHSCFHSTAYYNDPSQRKMIEKGWLGADLIFDLDGDHLPGVSR